MSFARTFPPCLAKAFTSQKVTTLLDTSGSSKIRGLRPLLSPLNKDRITMNNLDQIRSALRQITIADVLGVIAIFAIVFVFLWVTP